MNLSTRKASVILSVCLLLPGAVFARVRVLPKKPPFKPPYDVIAKVDRTARTVTIKQINSTDHAAMTYRVDEHTEIQVNGGKGTFNDVKTGMKVDLTKGADESTAERLVLSPAPATPGKTR